MSDRENLNEKLFFWDSCVSFQTPGCYKISSKGSCPWNKTGWWNLSWPLSLLYDVYHWPSRDQACSRDFDSLVFLSFNTIWCIKHRQKKQSMCHMMHNIWRKNPRGGIQAKNKPETSMSWKITKSCLHCNDASVIKPSSSGTSNYFQVQDNACLQQLRFQPLCESPLGKTFMLKN